MFRFQPVPSASEPCCPAHCAMGIIAISDVTIQQYNFVNFWLEKKKTKFDKLSTSSQWLIDTVMKKPVGSFGGK